MEMRTPWQISKAVWYALILRELQSILWSRRFGAFWVLAEPIVFIIVLTAIRVFLRGRTMTEVPFPLWLLVGLVPFLMMRQIMTGLMGAVDSNKSLFTYRQVKPIDTYVARTAVPIMINMSVLLILGFAMVFFLGYQIPIDQPIQMLATLTVMILFAFAIGIILGSVVHALPDIAPIVRLMFLPLMILSGVIFPVRNIPQPYYDWLLWNPFLHLVDMFRQYSLFNYTPLPGVSLSYPALCALYALFIAAFVYRRRQYHLVSY
jgi:capsular polysaccharide transport system permease protein